MLELPTCRFTGQLRCQCSTGLGNRNRVHLSTGVVVVIPARAVRLKNSLTCVKAPRKESNAPFVGGPCPVLAGLENG